ncbi:O-antigen ligase family protein [Novipirellula artificiosorum]|uniref:O-Antigen ligase n=1 Tax=Novipirellula artificiosorum TaxID=2528016 RepID=A0A5C6D7P2_9BACT|nr:O-antigen ligase family protein [Novipirellula artificiosorum]TWU31721.1 O-Antigen ligase [Novipirellula artificiosorum]
MGKQRQIAACALAALLVYSQYDPSDSTSVEQGDALWFALFALLVLGGWFAMNIARRWSAEKASPLASGEPNGWTSMLIEVIPWLMAAWMVIAAFGSSPPGNLRYSTNEAWFWISAAAIFFVSRRVLTTSSIRRAMLGIMLGCAIAQSVHGLHQQFVSLPQTRAEYEADPDAVLAEIGIDAPLGSSERNVFENRLRDGGPTGTFALANSLAAVLLVGVLIAVGILRFLWIPLKPSGRIAWLIVLSLTMATLLATRSRSALLAALLGAGMIVVLEIRVRGPYRKWFKGMAGLLVAGFVGLAGLAVFGNPEWLEQAPASLMTRLQYWRSTLRMAAEFPLFGAGPGNFQALYERFREPSASEQIADPHHFLFETLGSGGWMAVAMLMVLFIAITVVALRRLRHFPIGLETATPDPPAASERWVGCGAAASILLVWLIGLITLQIPDLDAQTFALPAALAAVVLATPSLRSLDDHHLDLLASVMVVAMMIHLSIASGWTIPGIAIFVWMTTAMVTSVGQQPCPSGQMETQPSRRSLKTNVVLFAMVVVAIGCLIAFSLLPVRRERAAFQLASEAARRGHHLQAIRFLAEATQADPWSSSAARWQADAYRWQLVQSQRRDLSLHRKWDQGVAQAKQRCGEDAAAYRELGMGQLHVYQRFGDRADLAAAEQTFRQASQWSPADEWMAAQMAEIARATGDQAFAQQMISRADFLSKLGSNSERMLERQLILVAEPIGAAVANQPNRVPASERFVNQLTNVGVAN